MRLGEVLAMILQGFAFKPKPRKFLKALLRNAFKNFLKISLWLVCIAIAVGSRSSINPSTMG
jgi:hypothetical protein